MSDQQQATTHVSAKFAEDNMPKLMIAMMRKLGIDSVTLTLDEIERFLPAAPTPDDTLTIITHGHVDSLELKVMTLREARQYVALINSPVGGRA